jgi:oxygen-independent coproporphyrinogen-3 oxidase
VLDEWDMYRRLFGEEPIIREVHLGGGTPTFFWSENLKRLINGILTGAKLHPDYEFSFEGHPNNTTEEHLRVLHNKGFKRVSFGVQDLEEKVQRAINRIQPFENVKYVTEVSRVLGYDSISFDLVYGLPHQTSLSVANTIEQIVTLNPDRVAFYSYAHVPWLRPGQRGYSESDLPSDSAKRELYEIGKELLLAAGYVDIGMDHFALPGDSLATAKNSGRLNRNFMGYTTSQSDLLIGLGASSISDARYAYAQNLKKVEDYQEQIRNGYLAVFKGHIQTADDMLVRKCILELACKGTLNKKLLSKIADFRINKKLVELSAEGLIDIDDTGISITEVGQPFIRNICSVFDLRITDTSLSTTPVFSKSI